MTEREFIEKQLSLLKKFHEYLLHTRYNDPFCYKVRAEEEYWNKIFKEFKKDMKKMTLQEFIQEEMKNLQDFQKDWEENSSKDPLRYPNSFESSGDWEEQYTSFRWLKENRPEEVDKNKQEER